MDNLDTFNPFVHHSKESEYHIISYVMVHGVHSMGDYTARLSSLRHVVEHLLQEYEIKDIAILDLTGFLEHTRAISWLADQKSQTMIEKLQVKSITPRHSLSVLQQDSTWKSYRSKAKVVIVYGLHLLDAQLHGKAYRSYQEDLLRYLPKYIPLYMLVDDEKDPRYVRTHRRAAIRPFRVSSKDVDYYSILPLHTTEILINLPLVVQGKSGLTLRDDQRVIIQITPGQSSPHLEIQQDIVLYADEYRISATEYLLPVLRNYCLQFENKKSLPGADSHELLEIAKINDWIGDYLAMIPWAIEQPLKDIETVPLDADSSTVVRDYYPRIINTQLRKKYKKLLNRDDARIVQLRKRIYAEQYQQQTHIPLSRPKGRIYDIFDHDAVVKKDERSCRDTIKMVLKYDLPEEILQLLDEYLNTTISQDELFHQLDLALSQTNRNDSIQYIWSQLKEGLHSYNRQLAYDCQQSLPVIGRWLLILSLPALFDIDQLPDRIYQRFSPFFALIDRNLGLIKPRKYKFDRRKVIDSIIRALSVNIPEQNLHMHDVEWVEHRGRLFVLHQSNQYIILMITDKLIESHYSWFESKQAFPTTEKRKTRWYGKDGIFNSSADLMHTAQFMEFVIIRKQQQQYLFVSTDQRTWKCIGLIQYKFRDDHFVAVNLELTENLPEFEPQLPSSDCSEQIPDSIVEESTIEDFKPVLSLTEYSFVLILYDRDDEDISFDEYDTINELLDVLKRGYVEDDGEKLYFNRFNLGYEKDYAELLQQIFSILIRFDYRELDRKSQLIPPPRYLHEYPSKGADLDWIEQLRLHVQHFHDLCICKKLPKPRTIIPTTNQEVKANKEQGKYHKFCLGFDLADYPQLEYLVKNNPGIDMKIKGNKVVIIPESLAFLYYIPLLSLEDGWYTIDLDFDDEALRIAQEDTDLIDIVKEQTNNYFLPLLSLGSYQVQRYIKIVDIIISDPTIIITFCDIQTGNYWDTTIATNCNSCCQYNKYLEELLDGRNKPLVDIFPRIGKYADQLVDPDVSLEDLGKVPEIEIDISDHEYSCEFGEDPDAWMVTSWVITDVSENNSDEDENEFEYEYDENHPEYILEMYYNSAYLENQSSKVPDIDRIEDIISYVDDILNNSEITLSGELKNYFEAQAQLIPVDIVEHLISDILPYFFRQYNIDIKKFLRLYQLQNELTYFVDIPAPIRNRLDIHKLLDKPLVIDDKCRVYDCWKPATRYLTRSMWHLGLCARHYVIADKLSNADWQPEAAPVGRPLRFDLVMHLSGISDDEVQIYLETMYDDKEKLSSCVFDDDCDTEIMDTTNKEKIFGEQFMVCRKHWKNLAHLYLLEFMLSNAFYWRDQQEMQTAVTLSRYELDEQLVPEVNELCTYAIMALQMQDKSLSYHFLMVLGLKLSSSERILAQGFLQLAGEFENYFDFNVSGTNLRPIELHFKIALNYQKLAGISLLCHNQAIEEFDLCKVLAENSNKKEEVYQAVAYYSDSLTKLGEFERALELISMLQPPLILTKNSEHAYIEIIINQLICLFELHLRRLNSYQSLIHEKISQCENIISNSSFNDTKYKLRLEEKKSKINLFKIRYAKNFDPNTLEDLVLNEIRRIKEKSKLSSIDFLILTEYCRLRSVRNIVTISEFEEIYKKEILDNINFSLFDEKDRYKIILYFEVNTSNVFAKIDRKTFEKLINDFSNLLKTKDIGFYSRLMLVKYYQFMINKSNVLAISSNQIKVLRDIFKTIQAPISIDFALDPDEFLKYYNNNDYLEKLKEIMTGFNIHKLLLKQ